MTGPRDRDELDAAKYGHLKAQAAPPPGPLFFRGADYQAARDYERLSGGLAATLIVMRDGLWRTKPEIRREIRERLGLDVIEESIGRYLRYAREPQCGAWTLERDHEAKGLYRYRLVPPSAGR